MRMNRCNTGHNHNTGHNTRYNARYKPHAVFFLGLLFSAALLRAQDVRQPDSSAVIKSNLLYGATATLNLGMEYRLGGRTSLDVPLGWNPWQFSGNRKWKHFLVQPEFRRWTRETFAGHFFGLHAHYAYYNVGNLPKPFSGNMRQNRYQGWLTGAGVSYGYRRDFSRHWGLEATLGVGYAYLDYDKHLCGKCGEKLGSGTRNYFGPTKAGISLVYAIGGGRKSPGGPAPAPVPPGVVDAPAIQPEPASASVPEVVTQTIIVEEKISTGDKLAQSYPYIASYAAFEEAGGQAVLSAEERGQAITVHFAQGSHSLSENHGNNRQTLTDIMASIRILENSADSEVAVVVVAGFASPEGDYRANERLAARRAEAVKAYILERSGVTPAQVRVHAGGIDWQGLRMLVEASDMPWQSAVLDIIDNTPVWDARRQTGRHGELMRLDGGGPYRHMLREFFPELRNAAYIKVYYKNK